ncbi:hypothetical protein VTN77DRAFT_6618 [Rasamsonia byssochlamydoides]|uniref:uncharacterized protein n=1 Tax=Rasamsonia byssochlamydoides TaxID=89139 RepID=UPI003743CFF7
MGSRDHDQIHSNTPKGQPWTPANAPTGRAAIPKAATTTKARHTRNKNKTPEPSISSLKPRRIRSAAEWESQTTLTQIDYVRRSPSSQEDDALDYIEENDDGKTVRKDGIEVIDLEDESTDCDTEYGPSNWRTREARTPRVQQNKDRADRDKSTGRHGSGSRPRSIENSGKKSSRLGRRSKVLKPGKLKEEKGKNKTLTQMDFVRRFIILDDSDDDRNLDYIEHSPKDQAGDGAKTSDKPSGSNEVDQATDDQGPRKKRKLSNSRDVSLGSPVMPQSDKVVESPTSKNHTSLPHPIPNPETPQKHQKSQKLEIPSSQSPESPAQMIIPSPHLRNVPRFPLKQLSGNTVDKTPEKGETTDSRASQRLARASSQSKSTEPESQIATDSQRSLTETIKIGISLPPSQRDLEDHALPSGTGEEQDHEQKQDEAEGRSQAKFEKTVVYETDAETDYGDFDDALPNHSSQSNQRELGDDKSDTAGSDNGPHSDDSQDLPPALPNSGTDLEGGGDSDLALPSDASLFYRRPPQYTQFPAGPVPLLNTQRIAELFPESNTQQDSNGGSTRGRSSPSKSHPSDILCPQTQTQTQSQDSLKGSTEVVPESSPVLRNAEVTKTVDHPHSIRPPQESVVLVESSQPVDKISKQKNGADQDSGPRRVVSAGQWLTDSVMESIPAPPWQLSQDSVGEPYPLPEG